MQMRFNNKHIRGPLAEGTLRGRWRDAEGTLEGLWRDAGGTLEGRWRDVGGTLEGLTFFLIISSSARHGKLLVHFDS
jgi:hypothetical protein